MNDLITAATSGLFVEVGKVIEHMKAQQARIADLERQLAEASSPAVEQHSYEHQRAVLEGERNAAADDYFSARELLDLVQNRRIFDAGFDRGFTARHCAPQATDTDKVREAIKAANDLISRWGSFAWSTPESGPYVYALKDAIAELRSTALQAPVREVPEPEGWREAMQEFVDRCERGEIISRYTYSKFKALLAPLPAAPAQQTAAISASNKEQA